MEQIVESSQRREKLVKVGMSVEILELVLTAEEKFLLLAALGRVQLESPSDAVLRVQMKTLSTGSSGVRAKLVLKSSSHSFEIESRGDSTASVIRQLEELACAELSAWRKSRLSL